ncbi:hypothetical protein VC83_03609 [Pseudogymnoascus destructans]|uniref:Uncharacterized protein n=2 Tax=Pseudogymnoascus destructans TaxID=655981 RepID=L8G0E6_PSED2|nr:uncharacterized protein VC83_03609 [Pseudogymnoascus destructans]ELR05446.1 hypothetical protein GMDG_01741 [Pseudogymnoascus destructans 20631-21]OAF60421.1 hypothetical protein VC83_03609 [Pseudogymnoascus destructans]
MSHEYPGINIDLRYYNNHGPIYPIGAHGNCFGANSELLPVREVFMMVLMDRLSDKVGWHKKVFDEEIVSKWRKEALEQPEDKLFSQVVEAKGGGIKVSMPRTRIISEAAFDYCIKELREKAAHFQRTGLIPTLDSAGNTIVKSDTVVTPELQKDLRSAFDQLRADQASDVDWHPRSDEKVQDLVHPSMYPLIFGKSNFFQEEVVGVSDAIELWAGKGEPARARKSDSLDPNRSYGQEGDGIPLEFWSDTYQWLPANLAFQEDGTVKFTSYINNLHPKKYPSIYRTIEKLIDTAIPAWDQFLYVHSYSPNKPPRAGRQVSRFSVPESGNDEDDALWEPYNAEVQAQNNYELTESDWEQIKEERIYNWRDEDREMGVEKPEDGERDEEADDVREFKWKQIRDPVLPEPDSEEEVNYLFQQSIREKFKDSGLQVIVKMATIELTPEKPDFPMGGWHVEGQMNERICATALFYLDSENVTPSHLSFRMQTTYDQDELQGIAGQNEYHWLERVYGTQLSQSSDGASACLQHYGSAETRQGRLLAFPNVFHHRVSPFKLQDPTKPGHRRFIALWLIDPHQRIISTGNVPPQQQDWWADAVFGNGTDANTGNMPPEILELLAERGPAKKSQKQDGGQTPGRKLPTEIMEMVRKNGVATQGLMTVEEARHHREELMKVRSRFHEKSEQEWEGVEYFFCEH